MFEMIIHFVIVKTSLQWDFDYCSVNVFLKVFITERTCGIAMY